MSNIIKFDTSVLDLVVQDGDKFVYDPRAEEALIRWLEFKRMVDDADKFVRDKLKEKMEEKNVRKIEGEGVVAYKTVYGAKYKVTDPQVAEQLGVVERVVSYKPKTKEIDEFVKMTDELPEGIELNDRNETVVIKQRRS